MPGLTGETLHGIFREADSELSTPWNGLFPYDKNVFTEVATVLNGTYLAPLQGVVRDALKLAQEGVGLQNVNEHHVWEECYAELEHEFGQLCNGKELVSQKEQIAQLQQKIDAFTSLLASYQKFIKRACAGHVFFDADCQGLLRITAQLLNDEQKG